MAMGHGPMGPWPGRRRPMGLGPGSLPPVLGLGLALGTSRNMQTTCKKQVKHIQKTCKPPVHVFCMFSACVLLVFCMFCVVGR